MKKLALIFLALAAFSGCATQAYDTFRARQAEYDTKGITLNPVGLTAEQIKAIYATRFPKKNRVSVALFYLVRPRPFFRGYASAPGYEYASADEYSPEDELKTYLVGALTKAANVERVVPIPPFVLPQTVTFEAVQQLGVRSLSEYSLLVFGDAFSAASWRKLGEGKYTFNSLVDFMLVDNETTAIIAADKLISTVDVQIEIFNDAEYRKAKKLLFTEQARILTEKMDDLFAAAGK